MALELGWSVDRVKYYLNKMKKLQVIKRVGSSHKGHWERLREDLLYEGRENEGKYTEQSYSIRKNGVNISPKCI